jgi:hypothetical protein
VSADNIESAAARTCFFNRLSQAIAAAGLHDEMRDNSYNVIRLGARDFNAEARRYNPGSARSTSLFRIRSQPAILADAR